MNRVGHEEKLSLSTAKYNPIIQLEEEEEEEAGKSLVTIMILRLRFERFTTRICDTPALIRRNKNLEKQDVILLEFYII
jgi:hypothetical protein